MTPAEAASVLRELHPSGALKVVQKNALVVAIMLLEAQDRAERAEDDTRPIALTSSQRLAAKDQR